MGRRRTHRVRSFFWWPHQREALWQEDVRTTNADDITKRMLPHPEENPGFSEVWEGMHRRRQSSRIRMCHSLHEDSRLPLDSLEYIALARFVHALGYSLSLGSGCLRWRRALGLPVVADPRPRAPRYGPIRRPVTGRTQTRIVVSPLMFSRHARPRAHL